MTIIERTEGQGSGITMIVCESEAEAREYLEPHIDTGGRVLECTMFRQGEREMLSTEMTFQQLRENVKVDPTPRGADARAYSNRALVPSHIKELVDYCVTKPHRFFLPGIILNVESGAAVLRFGDYTNGKAPAFLLLEGATRLRPVGGGHRCAALMGHWLPAVGTRKPVYLAGVLDLAPDLSMNVLPVQITLVSDPLQQHQDFADESKGLAMNKNIAGAYDSDQAGNALTLEIIDTVDLFTGRIETGLSSVSKDALYTFSAFKAGIQAAYIGHLPSRSDGNFDKLVEGDKQRDSDAVRIRVERIVSALRYLSTRLPGWREAIKGVDGLTLRKEFVTPHAPTMQVIGALIGQAIQISDKVARGKVLERMAVIDWSLTNPEWQQLEWVFVQIKEGKEPRYRVNGPLNEAARRYIWDQMSPMES